MLGGSWLAYGEPALPENRQRNPPAATPLEFPQYAPPTRARHTEETAKQLYCHFAAIHKPTDVKREHVELLNLRVLPDLPLDDIIPRNPADGSPFLPDRHWGDESSAENEPANDPGKKKFLCNGREAPGPELYQARKKELTIDNEDGYRAAQRFPPLPGSKAIKPGYFYKFWQGLFLMSVYWDTSLDNEVEEHEENTSDSTDSTTPNEQPRKYKGRRSGTGRDMPDQFREDTIKALVDTVTWLFGCQVSAPRLPPRLTMQSSFFSVRLSYFVYQTPTDRQRIRQGIVEGPVMGVQTRHETQFRKPEEQPGTGEMEALDLLKEVAALLLLAQERAREGKSEKRPGEGKWYTSKPRWGGGSGDEVGPASGDNGDDAQKKDDKTSGLRMRGRRLTAAEAYKRLSPGMGTWDSRTTYMALGKVDGSDIDDVFLVSSINHHVSILRLRVNTSFIRFLETGKPPPPPPSPSPNASSPASSSPPHPPPSSSNNPPSPTNTTNTTTTTIADADLPWDALELRRSKWYDLFSPDDRAEAMRAIWGVMSWLMRDKSKRPDPSIPSLEHDNDVVMSD